MSNQKVQCIICAYRAACQKQFSLKAGQCCPEFERDLMLKEKGAEAEQKDDK